MDARTKLGENIRRLRKLKGFTQETFADHCGIHRNYISDMERGRRNPSVDILEKLAVALNVGVAKLFE